MQYVCMGYVLENGNCSGTFSNNVLRKLTWFKVKRIYKLNIIPEKNSSISKNFQSNRKICYIFQNSNKLWIETDIALFYKC